VSHVSNASFRQGLPAKIRLGWKGLLRQSLWIITKFWLAKASLFVQCTSDKEENVYGIDTRRMSAGLWDQRRLKPQPIEFGAVTIHRWHFHRQPNLLTV